MAQRSSNEPNPTFQVSKVHAKEKTRVCLPRGAMAMLLDSYTHDLHIPQVIPTIYLIYLVL
jgi:hypothetical protein